MDRAEHARAGNPRASALPQRRRERTRQLQSVKAAERAERERHPGDD